MKSEPLQRRKRNDVFFNHHHESYEKMNTDAKPVPATDRHADARALFETLDQIHVCAIHPDRGDIFGSNFGRDVDAALKFCADYNSNGFGLYWTVNRVRDDFRGKKAKKSDITNIRFLHVDLDPPKGGSPFDKAAVTERLQNSECPPSFIINSGNGLGAFWRLDGPHQNFDAAEYVNRQIAAEYVGDYCFNIDRVMRVPSFTNYPNKAKLAVGRTEQLASIKVADSGQVYEAYDVSGSLPDIVIDSTATEQGRSGIDINLSDDNIVPMTLEEIGINGSDASFEAVIHPEDPDRSAAGLGATRCLALDGMSDEQIAGILCNPDYSISAHFLEQRYPSRAIKRAIGFVRIDTPYYPPSQTNFDELLSNMTDNTEGNEGSASSAAKQAALELKAANLNKADNNTPPLPLQRLINPPEEYPTEALGTFMGSAVEAVARKVQLPAAIAAGSALANASLAVQGHVDVDMPLAGRRPVSLFMFTLASSGDRKSKADNTLGRAVADHERKLREIYDKDSFKQNAKVQAHKHKLAAILRQAGKNTLEDTEAEIEALGPEPAMPKNPMLLATDPTLESAHINLSDGPPSQAVFSDEGAQFTTGYGMSPEKALKTAAGFSGLWDASPIRRSRVLDGNRQIYGKRMSFHLMIQVDSGLTWLGDPSIRDQGLFGRLLIACPETMKGTRFSEKRTPWEQTEIENAIDIYNQKLADCFALPFNYVDDDADRAELEPRALGFSDEARKIWLEFYNEVEAAQCPKCPLNPIYSLSSKAAEHMSRIAAVLAFFNDPSVDEIGVETTKNAIELTWWYLREALRLNEAAMISPDLALAEKLLEWIDEKHTSDFISAADVYQNGPNALRTKERAEKIIKILVNHGWLRSAKGTTEINGQKRRKAYEVRHEYFHDRKVMNGPV